MFANLKFAGALVGLACVAVAPMMDSASAESLEVAKKCNALAAKAFPPREIGNPAAGSAKGTGRAEQDYYKKCIANSGKMDNDAGKGAK
jgi:hypothetical protein